MEILKTYKLYIDGQFPRTESGRTYTIVAPNGSNIANACLASRKDVRNAVVAARKAQRSWAARSGFNRSQIAYRIAEMLEDRKALFIDELQLTGLTTAQAQKEIQLCIDRCVYYAGWADKYQNLIGGVNPVSSAHFNFSVPEAMGVAGVVACQNTALIGLISQILPLMIGGNTVVVLANSNQPLSAISFAEVLATSDVPNGVVNILSGQVEELLPTLAGHMDVNALSLANIDPNLLMAAQETAIDNLKRCAVYIEDFTLQTTQGLAYISAFQEIKTTWHPIEQLSGGGSGY